MLRGLLKSRQAEPTPAPRPAVPRAGAPSADLKIRLVAARLVLTSSSTRTDIRVEGPAMLHEGRDGRVIGERQPTNEVDPMVRVTVPTDTTVEIESGVGDLTVFNFDGALRARLQAGNARIDHVSGQFRVIASEGSVYLEQARGRLEVLTTRGNIEAHHVEGELQCVSEDGSMRLQAIDGPLVARSATGGITAEELDGVARLTTRTGELRVKGAQRQLTLRSQTGDISLEASIVDHTTVETFKGRIEIGLWRNTDARIEAYTKQGVVRTERIALAPGSGRRAARSTVGAGRARLSVSTGTGVIEITGPRATRSAD